MRDLNVRINNRSLDRKKNYSNFKRLLAKESLKFNIIKASSLKNIKLIILNIALITIALIAGFNINAKASNIKQEATTKYYTSIEIKNQDTLWDLAKEYNNGRESQDDYINNLMSINNLNSDTIIKGEKLIIYYYAK